ncbi:hypothetical protein G6011_04397 [Alternaria panax]|uniref:Uncharacterized protein n=1 Tax=Alternaria panax TaxID=48097 RepID=A0AAD4NTV6_9PLEO|nr:hypothetical protein G6011_04397 [Alternaria panax]
MAPRAEEPNPDSGVDLISYDGTVYGDGRDDFHKNGTVIMKGAISPERAECYKQKQIECLQSFGPGFDPNAESTWTQEHVPVSFKGGMYFAYSSTHEKFVCGKLYAEFFREQMEQDSHEDKPPEEEDFKDLFIFKEEDVKCFQDWGCTLEKVNLDPW